MGCATLPDNNHSPKSHSLVASTPHPLIEQLNTEDQKDSEQSGFLLLGEGYDAFVARAVVATQAVASIDAQYYLWHDDLVGRLFVKMLLDAADRGVRVRLLVDDIALARADFGLAIVNAHPNFQVRTFNPFSRRDLRTKQYVTGFGRVTRRMHNKSFTVDGQITIVGGRNIGNEYFEADPAVAFGDLDALAIGPVVQQVSESFDDYWNHTLAYPIESLSRRQPTSADITQGRKILETFAADQEQSEFVQALRAADLTKSLTLKETPLYWGHARVIADQPDKLISNRADTDLQLAPELTSLFQSASREILILSPYFVPGRIGVRGLLELQRQGIQVRVLTNSLASNNHKIVHANYAKYRKSLLRGGVELYEAKNAPIAPSRQKPFSTSKASVLHAKSFLIDRKSVFIGSMNFDPRSLTENTEIGIVFESEAMAKDIGAWFDDNVPTVAYQLSLNPTNDHIVWAINQDGSVARYAKEPDSGFWQRLAMHIMRWLPGESQL